MIQIRRTKSFGPIRLTFSKRGMSTSLGGGPFRASLGADGKVRRTWRLPGTGVFDTKTVGAHRADGNRGRKPKSTNETFGSGRRQPRTARRIAAWMLVIGGLIALALMIIG